MSNVNTPDVLAHSMAESLMRENKALRAEVASLKEREQALRDSKRQTETDASDCINTLTQQLAAANGRVERMLTAADEYINSYLFEASNRAAMNDRKGADEARMRASVAKDMLAEIKHYAALSNLNEDSAG
jgi:hypothetical protein